MMIPTTVRYDLESVATLKSSPESPFVHLKHTYLLFFMIELSYLIFGKMITKDNIKFHKQGTILRGFSVRLVISQPLWTIQGFLISRLSLGTVLGHFDGWSLPANFGCDDIFLEIKYLLRKPAKKNIKKLKKSIGQFWHD